MLILPTLLASPVDRIETRLGLAQVCSLDGPTHTAVAESSTHSIHETPSVDDSTAAWPDFGRAGTNVNRLACSRDWHIETKELDPC